MGRLWNELCNDRRSWNSPHGIDESSIVESMKWCRLFEQVLVNIYQLSEYFEADGDEI